MEELIVRIFENSIVGGAFVYMLWYVTSNFKQALDANTKELTRISKTLSTLDRRIERLEGGQNK